MNLHALSGMKDYLGGEAEQLRHIESIARDLFRSAGFREIKTPTMEDARLFDRSLGTASDIVSKEMYTVKQSDERQIALRPENTAGVVRAVNENDLMANRNQLKLFYSGSMYRHERPQSGRYRQFHQIGLELFGRSDPLADAEVVHLGAEFLERCGVGEITCKINSIGTPEERTTFQHDLVEAIQPYQDELTDDDRRRLEQNPLRMLDSKDERCQEICQEQAPSIRDYLGSESESQYQAVLSHLDQLGLSYEQDETMVRGLDYYSRTTFEYVSDNLGAQDALGGGGRYDGLSELLGGDHCPAIGFATGLERIMLLSDESGEIDVDTQTDCYLIPFDDRCQDELLSLLPRLRDLEHPDTGKQLRVEMGRTDDSLRAQLRRANRYRASVTLLLGSDELEDDIISLKRMDTGDQLPVDYPPEENLVEELTQQLSEVDEQQIKTMTDSDNRS